MNYNHLMEKYELYGGICSFDKSQKNYNLIFFQFVTHFEIVNVGTKSHQIETDSYFSFFKISVLSIAFFWNRESFNKMFTQSAYVSFFLFYVSFFCSLNLCYLFFSFYSIFI